MKFQELKNKNTDELHKLLQEYRDNLVSIRFKIQIGQYKKVREIRSLRKSIAQILTVMNQEKSKKIS